MPKLLTPQEIVLLQTDTNYLNQGMTVWESRVVYWDNRYVLIYRSLNEGYFLTDITDLGTARIQNLAAQSEVHGVWYYLPQSIGETISETAEDTIATVKQAGGSISEIAQNVAADIGQTLANLLQPVIDTLMIPIIIAIAIGAIYLFKKG